MKTRALLVPRLGEILPHRRIRAAQSRNFRLWDKMKKNTWRSEICAEEDSAVRGERRMVVIMAVIIVAGVMGEIGATIATAMERIVVRQTTIMMSALREDRRRSG
jgi:hypothetical protein